MNDQERQIIADIFRRLEQTQGQTRDPEADRLINEKIRTQPYAPYAMAQAIYVQEEALKTLNEQVEQLRAENEELRSRGSSGGGLLSSIFGGGSRQEAPGRFAQGAGPQPGYGQQPPYGQPGAGGPWGGQQAGGLQPGMGGGPWGGQGQPQQAAGGGFLRGALTTAAGVAGGMLVGSALANAFSGGHSTLGNLSSADMSSLGGPLHGSGSGIQDASFSDGGSVFDDGGVADDGGFADDSWS